MGGTQEAGRASLDIYRVLGGKEAGLAVPWLTKPQLLAVGKELREGLNTGNTAIYWKKE